MFGRRSFLPVVVLAPLCVGGCSGPPEEPAPSADAPPVDLATCPAGEEAWKTAIHTATAEGAEALAALQTRLDELSEACPGRWEPLWASGRNRISGDEPQDPTDRYEACLEAARSAEDAVGVAVCADDLAWARYLFGRYEESEALFEESLAAGTQARRLDLQSFTRSNHAALMVELGRYSEASDLLGEAATGLERLGLRAQSRAVAFNRAVVDFELGNAVAAEEGTLALYRRATDEGDTRMAHEASILLGNAHLILEEADEARRWFATGGTDDDELVGLSLLGSARAALLADEPASAVSLLEGALETFGDRFPVKSMRIECYLADAERLAGNPTAARRRLMDLVERADAAEAAHASWIARWLLGSMALAEGDPAAALPLLRDAVARVETMEASLDPTGEGLRFRRERSDVHVDLAAALASLPAASRDDSALLSAVVDAHGRGLRSALNDDEDDAPPSLADLQGGLSSGERLLVYLLGKERGLLVAIGPDGLTTRELPDRGRLLQPIRRFRERLQTGTSDAPGRLADGLEGILPLDGQDLAGVERLYVVADRELALVPFSALPSPADPSTFLGESVEVVRVPTVSVPRDTVRREGSVLLAGQPRFAPGDGFEELPWSAVELARLGEVWGSQAQTLSGQAFNLERLEGMDLSGYRTLHFATHAVASTRDPRQCGVVLSGAERLGLERIRRLQLSDALVVLSACRTGVGELVPGEGVVGLARSFLEAGAAGIVVTHWPVDDAAAARLMVAFHRELAEGRSPAAALAEARRARHAAGDLPRDWAPFEIVLRP